MPQRTITDIMLQHAQHAVDEAAGRYRIKLDYSIDSISQVDRIVEVIYFERDRGMLAKIFKGWRTRRVMRRAAVMWGGYVGEAIRRSMGGQWHARAMPGGPPHIELAVNGRRLPVVDEIFRRVMDGPTPSLMELHKLAIAPMNGGRELGEAAI